MQFVLDLVKETTIPFVMLMVVVLGAVVLPLIVWMSVKPNRLSHEQKKWEHERMMAKVTAEAQAELMRINRDVPRLANGKPAQVIDNN